MRKYFSEDYVIPSPKLNENQKKRFSLKSKVFFRHNWSVFLPKLGENQNQKKKKKKEVFAEN